MSAFDPDAYLASKGAAEAPITSAAESQFNPDEYLSSKGVEPESDIGFGTRMAGAGAAIFDMIAGFPGFLAGMGAGYGVGNIEAAVSGKSSKESLEQGSTVFENVSEMVTGGPAAGGALLMGVAMSPFTGESIEDIKKSAGEIGRKVGKQGLAGSIIKSMSDKPEDYDQNVVADVMGKVSEGIDKTALYLEGKNEDLAPAEAVRQFANVLMAAVPALGQKGAGWARDRILEYRKNNVPKGPEGAEGDILGRKFDDIGELAKTPPTPAEITQLKSDVDAHIKAETTAHELMQRGASIKEVERAIKRNPMVAEKMDLIRANRADAASAFDRDFGARQGEVLKAGEGGEPRPAEGPDMEPKARANPEGQVELKPETRVAPNDPNWNTSDGWTSKPGGAEAGSVDKQLLFGLAGAGLTVTAFNAMSDQDKDWALQLAGLGAITTVAKVNPLKQVFKEKVGATSDIIENLPAKTSFTKDQIQQQLNRPEYSQAERDIFKGILKAHEAPVITAYELADAFNAAVKDFKVTSKNTDQFTTRDNVYGSMMHEGFERIGQFQPADFVSLFRFPDGVRASRNNHFKDDQLFGWVRGFKNYVEGGDMIPHIVEIQSDLAQHAKPLTPVRKAAFEQEYEAAAQVIAIINAPTKAYQKAVKNKEIEPTYPDNENRIPYHRIVNHIVKNQATLEAKAPGVIYDIEARIMRHPQASAFIKGDLPQNFDFYNPANNKSGLVLDAIAKSKTTDHPGTEAGIKYALEEVTAAYDLRLRELQAAVAAGDMGTKFSPILKNWPRRLVQETLADNARKMMTTPDEIRARDIQLRKLNEAREAIDNYWDEFQRSPDGNTRLKSPDLFEIAKKAGVEADPSRGLKPLSEAIEAQIRAVQDMIPATDPKSQVVRFGTADTVAKVEGWPARNYKRVEQLTSTIETLEIKIRQGSYPEDIPEMRTALLESQQELARIQDEISNPSGKKFEDNHQTIYDRYQKEITPYLKELGGKDYTDPQGHTWIEVPVTKGQVPRMWNSPGMSKRMGQSGMIDHKLLIGLGLASAGFIFGAKLAEQDKLEAALVGGLSGAALSMAPRYVKALKADWKATAKTTAGLGAMTGALAVIDHDHPMEGVLLGMLYGATKMLPKAVIPKVGGISIDDFINLRNGALQVQLRKIANVTDTIKSAVPSAARRGELALALERGDLRGFTPAEVKAAGVYREFMKSFGENAKNEGLINDLITNYVTHVIETKGLPKSQVQETLSALFGNQTGTPGLGGSQFAKIRRFETFQELQNALEGTGLHVKTIDLAEIVDIYGRSMGRAIENSRLISNLKGAALKNGEVPMMVSGDRAPPGYVPISSPQTRGQYVHPDIVQPLKFVLGGGPPGEVMAGMLALSLAQKRIATGLSLFHASNLINAYAGAMGTDVLRFKTSVDAALKAYRKGGSGDAVDLLLKNGLEMGKPLETDLNALNKLGELADSYVERMVGTRVPIGEKALGAIETLQRETFDKVTWDYLQPGMKLAVALKKLETGLLKNPNMPPAEVARQAASFANDSFGGLDWYRVATESQSALGRKMALGTFSPAGRRALQVLMFAPDWTVSTFRAMYKAFPGASDLKLTQQMHRGYVLRTAVIYATIMNGYNMVASGHPIWENKDPTKIEWRDGTTQQIAKHAMEGAEWLEDPWKTASAKLGYIPKELIAQAEGKMYLAPGGKAPAMESRVGHVLQGALPISVQQFGVEGRSLGESTKRAALGAAGFPIYRLTHKEKELLKAHKKREKAKQDARNRSD